MMGAYSIRRLIDSGKSSSSLPSKRIGIRRHANVGRKLMLLDRFNPELFYDIEKSANTELSVQNLCNQIIHSFIFQIHLQDDSTTSVVFVSDDDRDKHLNGISFQALAELFDYVGREEVLRFRGSMRAGVQTMENFTNHDAVEAGQARYLDNECVSVDWDESSTDGLRRLVQELIAEELHDAAQDAMQRHDDKG